jgi:hypothetical protein
MRAGLPCTTHGNRLAHLAAFARSLEPQAKPPALRHSRKG